MEVSKLQWDYLPRSFRTMLGDLNRILRCSQLFIVRSEDGLTRTIPIYTQKDDRLTPSGAWLDELLETNAPHIRPVVVADASTSAHSRLLLRSNVGAYVAAPIILRDDRLFGYLCATDDQPREYEPREVELLDWSAGLVAYLVDVDQATIVDPLTGALNRTFLQRLKSGLHRDFRPPFAVVFIDLDNFKEINDQYGHNFGDEVLKIVTHRLKRRVRLDDAVIRYGGDEFVVLMSGIADRKQVVGAAARRLLDAVEREYSIENQGIRISASVGVSICSGDTEDIDDLIQAADTAMYAQKANGGSGFQISMPEDAHLISTRDV